MGKLIFPDWKDEDEKPRTTTKTYLGYGYWIFALDDGTTELYKEKHSQEYVLPLGECKEFDERGYPIWKELVHKVLKDAVKGTLLENLGILEEKEDCNAYADKQDEEE